MTDDRIIKAYQGMSLQNFCTLNNSTREIHLVSCGASSVKIHENFRICLLD